VFNFLCQLLPEGGFALEFTFIEMKADFAFAGDSLQELFKPVHRQVRRDDNALLGTSGVFEQGGGSQLLNAVSPEMDRPPVSQIAVGASGSCRA
jgi:hypothetical protein